MGGQVVQGILFATHHLFFGMVTYPACNNQSVGANRFGAENGMIDTAQLQLQAL